MFGIALWFFAGIGVLVFIWFVVWPLIWAILYMQRVLLGAEATNDLIAQSDWE